MQMEHLHHVKPFLNINKYIHGCVLQEEAHMPDPRKDSLGSCAANYGFELEDVFDMR